MADGEITVKLGEDAARRLQAAAEAAGQPVGEFAADLIADFLLPDEGLEQDLRELEDCERTGVTHSIEEGLAVFDAAVARRLERGR